jgi:hypothetical protein
VRVETAENTVSPDVLRGLVAAIEAEGGVWMDLSEPPPGDVFSNDHHLDPRGQQWFTARLAGALRKAGLRPDRPVPEVLPAPVARRVGEPPPLPAVFEQPSVRRDCGRAWRAPGLVYLAEDRPWAASPLSVLEDGVPLARRATPGAPACKGTWRFVEDVLAVAPRGDGALTLDWDPSPVLTPPPHKGQQWADRWWVVPGTATELPLPPGPYTLWVSAELRGPAGPVRVAVNGRLTRGAVDGRRRVVVGAEEVAEGPVTLSVATRADGPAVLIGEVALRRPGEDAWTFVVRSGRRPIGE